MQSLNSYENQVRTLFYKDKEGIVGKETRQLLSILLRMKQLTTIKLHPRCATRQRDGDSLTPITVSEYFRQHLPAIVKIEIDSLMDED